MMQYTLIKIPVKEVLEQTFDITISKETEIERGYRITQSPSLLFDQNASFPFTGNHPCCGKKESETGSGAAKTAHRRLLL